MKLDQQISLDIAKSIENGIYVEVGTWEGDFSYELLKQTTLRKVYCVDPYKHFIFDEYPDAMNKLTQDEFDNKFNTVNNRFKEFSNRVEFIREESVEASKKFTDNSVDYVYIDANHDYKYVINDIKSWWPKIKVGGWLCGDDICSTDLNEHDSEGNVLRVWYRDSLGNPTCWGKYGTFKAVYDLKNLLNYDFSIVGTQFIIQKK